MRPGRRALVLRLAFSLGSLLALGWWLEVGPLLDRLAQMRLSWVTLALVVSVGQVAVSAWRWRFTAARLGLRLSYTEALREYYLSMFLNQLLPGGFMGDVSRAWRQAGAQQNLAAPVGPAIRAVIIERLSGQIVMLSVAWLSVVTLLPVPGWGLWVTLGVMILLGAVVIRTTRKPPAANPGDWSVATRMWRDARVALLAPAALPKQLGTSVVVVSTYLVTYLIAARAVGDETPAAVLVPLVAPVLVAMLVPVTIAGWGLREGAAAVVWNVGGLQSQDGVLVSVAYGLLVAASSLPGALVLVSARGFPLRSRSKSMSSPRRK